MFALQLLPELMTQRLAWVLVHFIWQGTVVAALLALSVRIGRIHRQATRYAMSLVALFLMAICPIATCRWIEFVPTDSLTTRASSPEKTGVAASPPQNSMPSTAGLVAGPAVGNGPFEVAPSDENTAASPIVEPVLNLASLNVGAASARTILSPEQPVETKTTLWQAAQPWIVVIWLVGVAVLSLRLLLGWIGIHRLRRTACPVPGWLTERTRSIAKSLRVLMPVIQLSQSVTEAIAVGFLKPMILLPITWATELPPDMLDAIIAHELAHIRRGDLWINLLQRVLETFLFYHPAIWWLSRRMRIERELCCDELVVGVTKNRLRYAETLEHVGRLSLQKTQYTLVVSITGPRTVLLDRIRHILNIKPRDPSSTAWVAGIIPLLVASLILWSAVTWRPGSAQAENAPVTQSADTVEPGSVEHDEAPVEPKSSEKVSDLEIALNAPDGKTAEVDAETIPVTVVDVENQPLAGVPVAAFEGAKQLPEKFVTDKQGQVRVPKEWQNADYFLCLVARDGQGRLGWFDFYLHGHSNNGQKSANTPLRLVLLPINRTVRGKLTDDQNKPLGGISVGIDFLQHPTNFAATHWLDRKLDDQKIVADAITNASGDFELRLPQDTFGRLRVIHPNWVSQRISVAKNQTQAPITRLNRAAKVTGIVIDAISKAPLAGVHIGAQAHPTTIRDLEVQIADKDVELARVELRKFQKANGISPGAFTETEVLRLQLAYDKALVEKEKTIKADSPESDRSTATSPASDAELKFAERSAELALVELMKVKKAPAAFTETEVLRLQLAYDKALLQIEKAVLSRSPDGGWGEAITDQNGRYEIGGLRSGVFNILLLDGAKKPLTAPAHEDVSVKSGEISKADFSLQTGRRLAGRVLDEITDEPVAKCVVGYYGPARPRSGGAILTVKTNERGEFEFFVPPGESHVYIADVRPNTPDSQGDVDVPADRDPEPIILKAGPKTEGGLKIFVGPPLERKVSVKLNREPLQSALEQICNAAAVKVNLDGDSLKTVGYTKNMAVTADLQNVPLGDALKHILKPFEHLDFIVEKDVVFVSTRKQTESRKKAGATAAPRSVKGVVKSESGQPIPGAHIALSRIGLIGGRHVTTDLATGQADDQGRYSVELTDEIRQAWTPTMKIAVWAIGKGVSAGIVRWVEDNPQVPPSERDQDFPLPPERALTVEIADEKEQPLKGHVLTFDLDGLRLPPQILKQMIRNPFEGTLTIHQMPSGFHEGSPALRTLRIQTASHGTLEFTWRVDQPGRGNIAHDDGLPVKLVAQPVTHLTGRLVAANGTLPAQVIRNVELSLETFHGDNSLKTPWVRGIAKVRTDAEGRFDIPTLACGKLTQVRTVLAADARWRPLLNNAERIALNPNATTNVDIPLTPTRTVRGQVRRPTGEGMPGVSFNISHGATVTQKLSEDRTSTTAAFFETVLTDLDGQFAVDLIPGDISFTMQFSSDTNIGTSELWPATKKGSTETQSGRFSQLPAGSEPLSLPTIYVSAYQGTLRDEAGKPVEAILVARGKTNSAAIGLTQTKKDGTFEIDVIGKADIWSAARRNEQGDFGLPGKDAPDVVVVSELPLVLQLKAGEESIPSAKAAAPAIDGLKPKEPSSPELEVENNDTIVDIQVEGNVSIADSSILPLVKTRKGRPASSKAVREDVMALFNTRWFTGVKPVYRNTSEGAVLIFRVTETNPSEPAASPAAVTRPGTPAQTTATVKLHPFETSTDNPAFDISLMKAISIAYRADHESMLHFDRISRDFAYGDFIWSADTKQLVGLRGATFVELKENLEEAAKIPLADLRRRLTGSLAQVAAKITDNQTGCMLVGSHEGHVLLLKTIKVQPRVLTVSLQRLTSDNEGRTEVPAVGIEQAVWGPVTDGLQAGIAYRDPDASRPASQYHLGELVRVKLFVRNTGQEPKSYSWRRWNINAENPVRIPLVDVWHPTILDAGGHQAITGRSKIHDSGERRTATLQPGETVFVGAASMALWPGINVGFGVFPNRQISVEVAPGRYQLSTELPTDLFGSTPIRTGSLQLDVVEPDKSQLNLIQQLDAIGHAVEPPEEDTSIGWRDATTGSPILAAFPRGPAEYQTIRCRAFDIETNQAVAGAVAKVAFMSFGDRMSDNLCEYDVLTGADGTFDMRIPRPLLSGFQRDWKPDYRVNITHPRYSETFDSQNLKDLQELGLVSNDGTIRNPAPAPELGTTRDPSKFASFQTVALKPARALSGRLLGADNKPLPNIHIYGSNSQGWPATPGLPRTDSEGRFQFNVPAKMTMKLEFRAAGFGRTFVTATPDQTNLGEIRPATGVRVGGLVLDAEGKPIPHIKVTTPSWPDQSSQPNFIYYADKDGRFQSDLLAAGEYQLEIGEISPPSERNKATISGPAPDLYVPVRFTVLADGKVPDFTIRPARATLIRSTLITTVPKPVKDEVARAIDPLYWRATVEKAQRERAKLKPSTPIKKTQTGQPVRFEVDDATGELAVKGDYEKQQDFAFNWVQAFFRIPNLLIRGKIGEQSWTRTPNFLELGSDTEPPAFTVKAPYDLTDVTFEPNDYVQHVQLDAGPKLFGKRFHVNQLGADIFDIKIYRYQPTTLKVTFVDAGGKRIVLPENELPSGFAVEARYAREAEVRKAGGRFDKSEGLMNPAILDDTVLRFVIPGEVIELSVTANGKEPIVRQITLEDGETRTITIQTEVQQTWNEHSAPTIQPATLKETKTP